MPTPAGVKIDRRRLLVGAAGSLLSVYGAGRLGLTNRALGDGIAQAAALENSSSPILVSVFLQGGVDSLSLLGPAGDPTYEKLRPTLAVPATSGLSLRERPSLYWHPSASSFSQLHNAGLMNRDPGDRITDPDMSPFTSRHYWEVGVTDAELETGWLGRYLDVVGSPSNPFQGLSLDGQMNPTLATAKNPVAAIDRPDNFSMYINGVWGEEFDMAMHSASSLGDRERHSHDPAIAQVGQAASEVGIVRNALKTSLAPQRALSVAQREARRGSLHLPLEDMSSSTSALVLVASTSVGSGSNDERWSCDPADQSDRASHTAGFSMSGDSCLIDLVDELSDQIGDLIAGRADLVKRTALGVG